MELGAFSISLNVKDLNVSPEGEGSLLKINLGFDTYFLGEE